MSALTEQIAIVRPELAKGTSVTGVAASAIINAVLAVVFASYMSAVLFNGPLAQYVNWGTSAILTGSLIGTLVLAALSRVRGFVTFGVNAGVLVVASVASSSGLYAAGAGETEALRVLTLLVATSLACGIFLLALGSFRLGFLVHFIPYPVICGFTTAIGVVMLQATLMVIFNESSFIGGFARLAEFERPLLSGLGFGLGFVLWYSSWKKMGPVVLSVCLMGTGIAFYAAILYKGGDFEQWRSSGWLLAAANETAVMRPVSWALLKDLDWEFASMHVLEILPLLATTLVVLIANLATAESMTGAKYNLDQELRVNGISNLLSFGGGASHTIPGPTGILVSSALHGRNRTMGVLCAALLALAIWKTGAILSVLPVLTLAGCMVFVALTFFEVGILKPMHTFSWPELGITVSIVAIIVWQGFMPGLAVGLAASFLLFVVNYSRSTAMRFITTGRDLRSTVRRNAHQSETLANNGEETLATSLQGYLFFGTTRRLTRQLNDILERDNCKVRYLIVDLSRVTGVDSTAIAAFERFRSMGKSNGFILLMTGIQPDIKRRMRKFTQLAKKRSNRLIIFDSLDNGLEWIEERILADTSAISYAAEHSQVIDLMKGMMSYFKRLDFQPNDILMSQGRSGDSILFIQSGTVSVRLKDSASGKEIRVAAFSHGTIVGEMGYYLSIPRTATVIADSAGVAGQLDRDALELLEQDEPRVALKLHQTMARILAQRLDEIMKLNRVLEH